MTESALLTERAITPDTKCPRPLAHSADEQNKQQKKEHNNHQRRIGKPEDLQAFINELAEKDNLSPQRVQWRIERIRAKAKGPIRSVSYFRVSLLKFVVREQYELVNHLTKHGVKLSREDPAQGFPDLIEALKREAARIGFTEYSDAVNLALRNLKRGG